MELDDRREHSGRPPRLSWRDDRVYLFCSGRAAGLAEYAVHALGNRRVFAIVTVDLQKACNLAH